MPRLREGYTPVVRDPLLSLEPLKTSWVASDAEECLQLATIEVSCRIGCSVIGHEVDDAVKEVRLTSLRFCGLSTHKLYAAGATKPENGAAKKSGLVEMDCCSFLP